ncbi:hypothetical protein CPB84DRAFT_1759254, partial [Gymnopilus junonius]
MAEYILGMDPITFTMTLFSIIGLILSILTFTYYYHPSRQLQYLSEGIDRTWDLFRSVCGEDLLPHHTHVRLCRYFDKLEMELSSLMFVSLPDPSVTQKLRAWRKTWSLFRLSTEVQNLNLVLLTISSQRSRLLHAHELKHQGDVKLYCLNLQANFEAMIAALTAFVGEKEVNRSSQEQLGPSATLESSATISSHTPHVPRCQSSENTPLPVRGSWTRSELSSILPMRPPRSYQFCHRQLDEV